MKAAAGKLSPKYFFYLRGRRKGPGRSSSMNSRVVGCDQELVR